MWLILAPSTSSRSAPATAGSISELTSQQADALAQSAALSGKLSPPRSWRRAWQTKPWLRRLSGATCEPSTADAGAESWIASLRATRASRSVSLASVVESAILATCGPKSLASLRKSSPASCSSRTSAATSLWDSRLSDASSKEWGIELRRDCLRRLKSARRTSGSGCSSSAWPTIRVEDAESCGQHPGATDALNKTAEMWPTPDANPEAPNSSTNRGSDHGGERPRLTVQGLGNRATMWTTPNVPTRGKESKESKESKERRGSGGVDLQTQADAWPTPGANDHKGSAEMGQRRGQLDEATEHWQTPPAGGGGSRSRSRERIGEKLIAGQAEHTTSACSHPDPAISKAGDESSKSGPTSRPRLNPAFVTILMGLPEGWVNFEPIDLASFERWATASFRLARAKPS